MTTLAHIACVWGWLPLWIAVLAAALEHPAAALAEEFDAYEMD